MKLMYLRFKNFLGKIYASLVFFLLLPTTIIILAYTDNVIIFIISAISWIASIVLLPFSIVMWLNDVNYDYEISEILSSKKTKKEKFKQKRNPIIQDLHVINDILYPWNERESIFLKWDSYTGIRDLTFITNLSDEKIRKRLSHIELKRIGDRFYETNLYHFMLHYGDPKNFKESSIIEEVIDIVNKVKDKSYFELLGNKYELSIRTARNTVEEAVGSKGQVSIEIKDKVLHIIDKFVGAIKEENKKETENKKRVIEATQKSLSDRLDEEIEYMERFL